MSAVVRAAFIYFALLVIFRVAGRRSIAQMTSFDFVLVLIIAEASQQALVGQDFSITNAVIVVVTIVMIDLALGIMARRFGRVGRFVNGVAIVVVEDGEPLHDRLRAARLREEDILEAARDAQGLERMDQIKFAVLEATGIITIVPRASP